MNTIQFEAACKLARIGIHSPVHKEAVRLVVCEGKTQKDAAEAVGMLANNLSTTMRNFNRVLKLAAEVVVGEKYGG